MTGRTEYVQAVALLRAGSHEDAVRAVAAASVGAWLAVPDDPAWQPWLAGSFAKSVRRARPAQYAALSGWAAASAGFGDARACAGPPTTYPGMDPRVAGLQVSGTELARAGWPGPGPGPTVLLDDSLGMSTGKAAAQAAHALFAWAVHLSAPARADWQADGMAFSVLGLPGPDFARAAARPGPVTIADAGHTEVAPGSTTAIIR